MRENYYILLDLDPSVTDEAAINTAIIKKQQAWSADRNHPTKGNIAQQNLSKLAQIKSVMGDPSLRRQEAEEAKKLKIAQEQEKNKDLINAGSILVKNGEILESELESLLKKSKFKNFTKEEALRILKARLKKEEVSTFKDDGIKALDDSVMKTMRADLNLLKKKDLFDFLGLSPTSSPSVLVAKGSELYNIFSRNANKTAEVTAGTSLASTSQTYLKDEDTKKRYQKSLEIESLSGVYELVDIAASNDKIVDAEQFQRLVKECANKGMLVDRAEYYIHEYCKKKSYGLMKAGEKAVYKSQIQCNVCYHLNDQSANNCGYCSSPLKIECPKCKHKANSIEKACIKCGFLIGDMPNAIYLIRDAKVELMKGNSREAESLIEKAEHYWPGNPSAVDLKVQINKKADQLKTLLSDIDKLACDKKYVSLKVKLGELKQYDANHSYISLYEKKLNDQITLASNICAKAKQEVNNERKLDLYLSALEECADYGDAISGSSALPISPPVNLRISKTSKMIGLQWNAPASSRALRYRVVRKVNGKPSSSSDGEIVAETGDLFFEDFKIESGVSYYYSVFSSRSNRFSEKAETQGPILVIDEVRNISSLSNNSIVALKWDAPKNVKRIEIFRSETQPRVKYGDGKKLIASGLGNFNDNGLTNEKEYYYTIFSIYEDCMGSELISTGATISAVPSAPPAPVEDLVYTITNKRVTLKWTAPTKGSVQILRSSSKLNQPVGTAMPAANAEKLGTIISGSGGSSAFFDINFQGQVYLTPLTIYNNNAIVGKEVCITSVEEVTNLKSVISGGRLYLEWTWPAGCDIVQIKYSHDRFPSKGSDATATTVNYTKEQYHRNSGYVINQPARSDYYFTVYTCSNVEGKPFFSNGVNELAVNSDSVTINYKAVVKKFLGKKAYVELSCSQKVTLPEMVVVVKFAGLPLNRNDGSTVASSEVMTVSGSAKIEIPFQHAGKNKFIKIFFQEDSNNKKYKLQMPKKEDLELS